MVRRTIAVVLVVLALGGASRGVASAEKVITVGDYSVTYLGLTVPLGGKILTGRSTRAGATGQMALYYTGFEKDKNLLHLRQVWTDENQTPAQRFEAELVLPLQPMLTKFVVSLQPLEGKPDNLPTMLLETAGVDYLLQLQVKVSDLKVDPK